LVAEGFGLLVFVALGVALGVLLVVDAFGVDLTVGLFEVTLDDGAGLGVDVPEPCGLGFEDDVGRGAAVGLPEGGRRAEPEAEGEAEGSVTEEPVPDESSG
jgi:hypothetical protein